jgi:His-Xaa-Ser system protein HxsD
MLAQKGLSMTSTRLSWVEESADDSLCICLDLTVYPLEVLFRVCYAFTDRCYLFLTHGEPSSSVKVQFARKSPDCELEKVAGEFSNELINQKVRLDIAAETKPIRELIVAQAFAEADLLDRSISEADYREDPRGIAK